MIANLLILKVSAKRDTEDSTDFEVYRGERSADSKECGSILTVISTWIDWLFIMTLPHGVVIGFTDLDTHISATDSGDMEERLMHESVFNAGERQHGSHWSRRIVNRTGSTSRASKRRSFYL